MRRKGVPPPFLRLKVVYLSPFLRFSVSTAFLCNRESWQLLTGHANRHRLNLDGRDTARPEQFKHSNSRVPTKPRFRVKMNESESWPSG